MSKTITYPLAKQGVFRTIQGEGFLLGIPMVFIRLAGCSVGCRFCDTDYRVYERFSLENLSHLVSSQLKPNDKWIWISGGEPADHQLFPLVEKMKFLRRVAVATSGHLPLQGIRPDFLSVSPHNPDKWIIKKGSEIKLIPGLNGFHLKDFEPYLENIDFIHKYVSPLAGDSLSIKECVDWIEHHPDWKLTIQAHKIWNLP